MKKKLLTLCSILLLIIGCSKAEPQQEEELTVVKNSVTTESIQVAGASYNPNVQNSEELEKDVVAVPKETMSYSKDPIKESVPTTSKKPYPPKEPKIEVVTVSEEDVDTAIVETLAEKIKEDEKISKATPEKEVLVAETTETIEEEPKKKSPTLWIIIGAIALGAGAILFKKK